MDGAVILSDEAWCLSRNSIQRSGFPTHGNNPASVSFYALNPDGKGTGGEGCNNDGCRSDYII